ISAFAGVMMPLLPAAVYLFIRWMRRNNRVRESVSSDGGRLFETKVLTAVLIAMTLIIEAVLLYLTLMPSGAAGSAIAVTVFQIAVFVAKLMLFNLFFILVRWTLPRFRYDQVQHLGWYYLLPLSLINIIVTAVIVVGVS
ncbi:MAG: NADH-quinone oxidoreductase subunit H, partial [Thiovulaceae bacterium]|nr:NADH-quinone oxidoreductase subunit H [Sulfurimonadaceae bacterium]